VKTLKNILDVEILRKESFPVKDFFQMHGEKLGLKLVTESTTLVTKIKEPTIQRPGLALAGFTDVYTYHRVQVMGSTCWAFLESQTEEQRHEIFEKLSRFPTPLWVLTHDLPPHDELLQMCNQYEMPLAVTGQSTLKFIQSTQKILDNWFAPTSPIHASLVDVYGVGMLFVGPSNIGKSECVLDLVERGHRLVADDMVKLTRVGSSIIGRSNHIIEHHMEVRGIGIIDIRTLFGIHAVRKIKKVEVIVELQHWQKDVDYQRTGLEKEMVELMGVPLSKVTIPVSPGKNITVIAEVIAMDTLMKLNGVDTAGDFNNRLREIIASKEKKRQHELKYDSPDADGDFHGYE
jgi:HPr kinase/phosphorylase